MQIHILISLGDVSNVGLKTNIPANRLLRTTEQLYCRECWRIEACTTGRQKGNASKQPLLPPSHLPGLFQVLMYLVPPLPHVNSLI